MTEIKYFKTSTYLFWLGFFLVFVIGLGEGNLPINLWESIVVFLGACAVITVLNANPLFSLSKMGQVGVTPKKLKKINLKLQKSNYFIFFLASFGFECLFIFYLLYKYSKLTLYSYIPLLLGGGMIVGLLVRVFNKDSIIKKIKRQNYKKMSLIFKYIAIPVLLVLVAAQFLITSDMLLKEDSSKMFALFIALILIILIVIIGILKTRKAE